MLATALLLTSCTTMEQESSSSSSGETATEQVVGGVTVGGAPASDPMNLGVVPSPDTVVPNQSAPVPEPYIPSKPSIYRGNDQVVRMPQAQPPVQFYGDAVSLNFEEAPLTEVVHAVMGDILQLDYIVEHPINGKVTLRTRTPVPRR